MNINFYVITLKNIDEYKKSDNYKSLSKISNKIFIIKGVILNEKQSKKYSIYSKSSIGITLAHIKTWKYIIKKRKNNKDNYQNSNEENNDGKNELNNESNYSIIFEDDAILNIDSSNFNDCIHNIIKNNEFDIYKLHSDFHNGFSSMASYIINHNSINKLLTNYKIILGHIDFDIFMLKIFNGFKILTHDFNIFKTDESESLNRLDKYNFLNILKFKLSNRSDKNLKDILCYKVFRINSYEIIAYEIILIFLLIISLILRNKYLFLIIIILLIL